MSKEGLESLFPMEDISVMGMWELLPHLNKFRVSGHFVYLLESMLIGIERSVNFQVRLKETIEGAILFRPHVVVTVDSKGFSFRLLKQLRGNMNYPLSAGFYACLLLM